MQAISGTPLAIPVGFAAFPNELFKVDLIMMIMVMIMMMPLVTMMMMIYLSSPNKTIPNSQQFFSKPSQTKAPPDNICF